MKKVISLILMGCGGVGRHLLQHIVSCRSLHAKHGIHLRVVGVCDSNSLLVASDVFTMELGDSSLLQVCRIKSDGSSLLTLGGSGELQVFTNLEATKKIIDVAALLGKSTGLALVDCSASSETIALLTQAVDLGCCIVMANKKPLTSTMEDYDKLISHPRHIRHESTVGAGLPVISSLHRILSSGDPVRRIIGSLSGTLGYVMSEVEDGKPISEVVRSAKSLGYTEPDPRDDLSGMDVARKALILARLLGWRINLDDIKIESLYPKEMAPGVMSVEEFLGTGLLLLDKDINERVSKASLSGNVLRYVCVIEASSVKVMFKFVIKAPGFTEWIVWIGKREVMLMQDADGLNLLNEFIRCEVGIQELTKDSPLGRLRGSDNVLEIYSRCYNDQPLVIQGAGAGNDTTAAGVLADIIDIQDLFP